jgi:ABC-2 type transport system permease protein
MRRVWLIARREVVAYASVPSFWLALLSGPLLMLLAALGAGSLGRAPGPRPHQVIAVEAPNVQLAVAMQHALEEAAELEDRPVRVVVSASAAAPVRVRLAGGPADAQLSVAGGRLSRTSLALLRRDVATVLREQAPAGDVGVAPALRVSQPAPPRPAPQDRARFARFSMTTLLWLALVGSLGLLLQAVVRERANRALETLLSAAKPSEIVLGKLAGVGALAALVTGVWLLGGAAVAASPAVASSPVAALALQQFADLRSLLFGALLFVLAFTMYGAAMIGLGALARDTAAAQNLSRPVFAVLLAVYFVGLGQVAGVGTGALPGLALLPPFAPFALLLAGPEAVHGWRLAVSLAGVGATSLLSLWLAAQALKGEPLLQLRPGRLAPVRPST